MTALAPTLEAFFTERLIHQRQASPNTIASYRDAWRLLLGFMQHRTGKQPYQLDLADLDAEQISDFLAHLETERHNSVRTRNARPSRLRSAASSASPPCATPSTPRSSPECSTSRPNAAIGPSSTT